jgi:hypothetical protein
MRILAFYFGTCMEAVEDEELDTAKKKAKKITTGMKPYVGFNQEQMNQPISLETLKHTYCIKYSLWFSWW